MQNHFLYHIIENNTSFTKTAHKDDKLVLVNIHVHLLSYLPDLSFVPLFFIWITVIGKASQHHSHFLY